MSKPVPVQHPAVVLRSQYRNLRSLVAALLVAVAALSATVAVVAIDRDGTTTTSSVASGRSYPTLGDPFQTRTQPTRPESRPDESAIASSISQAGSRSYPTLDDPFQSQVEQPRPLGGPDGEQDRLGDRLARRVRPDGPGPRVREGHQRGVPQGGRRRLRQPALASLPAVRGTERPGIAPGRWPVSRNKPSHIRVKVGSIWPTLPAAERDFIQATRERVVVFDGGMGATLEQFDLTPEDYGGLKGKCHEALVLTARTSSRASTSR